MADMKVEKISEEKKKEMGIESWPIWEKETSTFDWYYDVTEMCYILKGDVTVTAKDGKSITFGPGDFVTFSKGLSCVWNIKSPVRKHYSFN